LPGFGWIFGVVNPGLGAVIFFVNEFIAEGGGPTRDVSVSYHKIPWVRVGSLLRGAGARPVAPLKRGYWPLAAGLSWAGPRASARVPTMGA